MAVIEEQIAIGVMIPVKREAKSWSKVWSNFEEIREKSLPHIETNFVRCTQCSVLIHKPTANTNPLLRHKCLGDDKSNQIKLKPEDKMILKVGAAKFIVDDLRPYHAVECTGLLDLCTACMKFGQLHRKATREDLKHAMPSRNTVKSTVEQFAKSKRGLIKVLLRKAIETGGIAATTDTWQDDYRKSTT